MQNDILQNLKNIPLFEALLENILGLLSEAV